jgi:hypothetical protein
MVEIITAKLQQHSRLVSEITKQGGSAWILSSTHQPTKQNSVWETGGKNWFIKSLNDAYLSTQSSTSVEERAADPILDIETQIVEYPVDTNQGAIQDVNEVLNSESAIVNQTTDSVTVKADVDAAETNIADIAQIMAELSKNSDSLIFDETGNAIIEDTDMSIPEATEVQQQEQEKLELDLFASEEISEASSLVEWWDANVEGNSVALEKLSGENIKTLEDAIALYGELFSQTEQGEQDIIERLKCLI